MAKLKKISLCILIIIVIFSIILAYYLYQKSLYSVENVYALLSSANIPTNLHVTELYFFEDSPESRSRADYYIKDNITYTRQTDATSTVIAEIFNDYNQMKSFCVTHADKKILPSSIHASTTKPTFSFSYVDRFANAIQIHEIYSYKDIYEYLGKETYNGRDCIKVSFMDDYDYQNKIITYYYIDLEYHTVLKCESYEGSDIHSLNKKYTVTYTYSYDTVTDEDVPTFDKNNYPDYEITGDTSLVNEI